MKRRHQQLLTPDLPECRAAIWVQGFLAGLGDVAGDACPWPAMTLQRSAWSAGWSRGRHVRFTEHRAAWRRRPI